LLRRCCYVPGFLLGACLAAACGSSSNAADAGVTDDGATGDGATGDGATVHAITSATPMAKGSTLVATHSGWGKADCASCHALNHDSKYTPPTCVGCHGTNGAPNRPLAQHPTLASCEGCHSAKHTGLGFSSPNDCATCHTYPVGSACGFTETYDTVVVGGGGGGLAAAAALARSGQRVILLEKSYKVGGCMTAFERGPYRFEASLHAYDGLVEGHGTNVDVWKALGIWGRVEIVRPDPMYRTIYPDFTIEVPTDVDAYKALLKQQFPSEADGIEALFADVVDIIRILNEVMSAQSAGTTPNLTADELGKLAAAMSETLEAFLDQYIHDPQLVAVWAQLAGFGGTRPRDVSALFFLAMWGSYHLGGFHYFVGGSQAVTNALADVIQESGGVIRTNSLVSKIVVENNLATQVQTADGACYNASYVVSNANVPDTVLKLVGADKFPADYVANINAMVIGIPVFAISMGVDHDYRDVFNGSHEIMMDPSYDIDASFEAMKACNIDPTGFSLTNYSVVDPGAAPAGKNVIVLTSGLDIDCFNQWDWDTSHASYKARKEAVAQQYLERAEAILPGLRDHIEEMEIITPQTIKGFTFNPKGTIFGWDNTIPQSLQNRLAQQTPVPNLYLAGAWTFPGGGQSAVLISGALAGSAILKAAGGQ
jgi:all-trans-retinol 13,14-reductase